MTQTDLTRLKSTATPLYTQRHQALMTGSLSSEAALRALRLPLPELGAALRAATEAHRAADALSDEYDELLHQEDQMRLAVLLRGGTFCATELSAQYLVTEFYIGWTEQVPLTRDGVNWYAHDGEGPELPGADFARWCAGQLNADPEFVAEFGEMREEHTRLTPRYAWLHAQAERLWQAQPCDVRVLLYGGEREALLSDLTAVYNRRLSAQATAPDPQAAQRDAGDAEWVLWGVRRGYLPLTPLPG